MSVLLGVSLKMYFGYRQTLDWGRAVATATARHGAFGRGEAEIFVIPSFPAIPAAVEIFSGTPVAVGAQDVATADSGAYTGEVSAPMLAEIGCRYVEVGHAERRNLFGEDEQVVAAKTAAVLRAGLVPVLCVGEAEHGPVEVAARECIAQVESALSEAPTGRVIVAYEPHWAIGAAEAAGDDHIRDVCTALRESGQTVIYGGSAAPGLLARLGQDVDGLFLGRFAHDVAALDAVLSEADELTARMEVTP
jgi:triosephosphate isomerase (TIM)